jgi:hypothetical protein
MTIFIFLVMIIIVSIMGIVGNFSNGFSLGRWYLMELDITGKLRILFPFELTIERLWYYL